MIFMVNKNSRITSISSVFYYFDDIMRPGYYLGILNISGIICFYAYIIIWYYMVIAWHSNGSQPHIHILVITSRGILHIYTSPHAIHISRYYPDTHARHPSYQLSDIRSKIKYIHKIQNVQNTVVLFIYCCIVLLL